MSMVSNWSWISAITNQKNSDVDFAIEVEDRKKINHVEWVAMACDILIQKNQQEYTSWIETDSLNDWHWLPSSCSFESLVLYDSYVTPFSTNLGWMLGCPTLESEFGIPSSASINIVSILTADESAFSKSWSLTQRQKTAANGSRNSVSIMWVSVSRQSLTGAPRPPSPEKS